MNLVDLFAILPFWLELFLAVFFSDMLESNFTVLRVLRAVRLVRIFRIFKLGRYSFGMKLMGEAITNSFQALWVLVFFLMVGVVLASSLMYYSEKMSCPVKKDMSTQDFSKYTQQCSDSFNNGVSPSFGLCCEFYDNGETAAKDFQSIFYAFWWAIVTMTTVGFGDIYPRTWAGKVVGFFVMLFGMVLIALPVAIVGQKFQDAYQAHSENATVAQAAQEKWTVSPGSDVCERLRGLKVKDPALADKVVQFTSLLDEVWEKRGKLSKEQAEEINRQQAIHTTFANLLHGLGQ
jgi:voltage-gated potassium channel Kch